MSFLAGGVVGPPCDEFVVFRRGSSKLPATSLQLLDELSLVLNGDVHTRVSVALDGYATKGDGTRKRRDALALARAHAIWEALVARGVDRSRFRVTAHGVEPGSDGRASTTSANGQRGVRIQCDRYCPSH